MRLHGSWAPLVTAVAALGVGGCGTSAPVTKPTVNVVITAPTSGATVGVRDVTVTGTVTPATAHVLVAGQPATVQGGSFRRTLRLDGSAQTVTVSAQAAGYVPAQTNTRVSYSAGLAAQLVASTRVLAASDPSAAMSLSMKAAPASASLLAQAVALPKATPAARHTTSATGTASTTTSSGPAGSTPTPTPTASTPTAPTPTPSPVATTPSPSPAPVTNPAPTPVAPSPAAIAARIKQQWESKCLQKQNGAKTVPYCTCIYTHLDSTGVFRTPATVKAFIRRVNHYIRTGDTSHVSRAVIRALSACQERFPASQSLGGRMSVTPFSTSHHRPATPAPAPQLPAGPRPTPISPNVRTLSSRP